MHTTKRQSSLLLSHTKHGLNKYLKKTNVIIIKKNNINPYIEEEQTTQWPKVKVQTTIYKTYT
jgi:hypothetical protein